MYIQSCTRPESIGLNPGSGSNLSLGTNTGSGSDIIILDPGLNTILYISEEKKHARGLYIVYSVNVRARSAAKATVDSMFNLHMMIYIEIFTLDLISRFA